MGIPIEPNCTCNPSESIQCYQHWREQHPFDHPIWCLKVMSGGLDKCDCDLSLANKSTGEQT